jgi:Fic family protein
MVRRLQDAYRRSYQKLLYEGVTEELIKELAGSIDPLVHPNKVATYRVLGRNPITGQEHFTNVRPQGASITPPYPDKIPLEMKRYIQELFELQRGKTIESFLNSAAFAHLHLARIHPFEDTNGRTARTLQNLILRSGKLPPAIIHAGERFDYYQHLDTAISGWKTRTGQQLMESSDGEKEFFNYIAGKVNVVLERVL